MSLVIWKTRVRHEYKKIKEKQNAEIGKEWRNNWNKIQENSEDRIQVCWPIKSIPKVKKVPTHVLNKITPLPPMNNWVLSTRNCMVTNEKVLYNLPFIGDQKKEAETHFLEDLLQSYGTNKFDENKWQKFDNDYFLEMVNSLKQNYIPSNEHDRPLKPIIFEALSAYHFKEFSPEELREKYEQLTNDDKSKVHAQPSSTCEHALQTFKKYFCRRCYMYNCNLHQRVEEEEVVQNPLQLNRNSYRIKSENEICSANCYKLKQHTRNSKNNAKQTTTLHSLSCNDNVENLAKLKIEEDDMSFAMRIEFSDDEKTLFRVLNNIFHGKYCIISQSMLTRSCVEVYEYAQQGIENISIAPSGPSLNPITQGRRNKGWQLYRRQKELGPIPMLSYSPCKHSVKSCKDDCSCVNNHACEKFCYCSKLCSNRFKGCNCRGSCNKGHCPCFAALRECDPDLCGNCGAGEYDLSRAECKNISIQRGLRKHLLLAPSDIAGWGVFLKDGARKGEFISEYVGEIISQEEADRRGKVYDMQKCSFLFELNKQYVVDATHQGGKIRFANHSINPNCYAKVMMVLGDHRIGIFAKKDILPGEEIFFDYRYATEQLKFVSIEKIETSS